MYDVPVLGDTLLELVQRIDRLTAEVTATVAEFDASGEWELDGATSAVAWLRDRARMSGAAAKAMVRTGRRLRSLPVTREAWHVGDLSGGQVQAVTANVSERTVELFAEHEAAVVPALVPLSVADTASAMHLWKARAEALLDDVEPAMPERSLHLSSTLDGRWELTGSLDAEGGEVVSTAIRIAMEDDFERTPALRRADALVDVCRFYLDHQAHVPVRRHRPHLNVVIDAEGARLVGGSPLDGPTARRLLCDAALHRVVTDGKGSILDYGRAVRTVPANLFSALVLRDGHCRHPGCDRPSTWCEAHHVVPWAEGGTTALDNLVLKCVRHHHMGHLPGWSEELRPDGELVVTDPQGRTRTTRPPGLQRGLLAA